MCSDQRSAKETTRRIAVGTGALEHRPRGRIEFSNEDNSTLHVHAYARVHSAARPAPSLRVARRSSASVHGC